MNRVIFKTILLKGEAGNDIQDIAKTATTGIVDTYTVTLTDGSTTTFNVTNGNGIVSVEKTATSGLVDTYTIMFTDGTTTTFDITNASILGFPDYVNNNGAKNLLQNTATTKTINGITFSVNTDGVVIIAGGQTATADTDFIIGTTKDLTPAVSYKISGCPATGSASTYCLGITNLAKVYSFDETFTATSEVENVYIRIKEGYTVASGLAFYPMIRLASDEDTTYKPYAKTNINITKDTKHLTDSDFIDYSSVITLDNGLNLNVKDCKVTIEAQQDLHGYSRPWAGGAGKNLLPMTLAEIKSANTIGTWNGNTYTMSGASFTVNVDNGGNVVSIYGENLATQTADSFLAIPIPTDTIYGDCQFIGGVNGTNRYIYAWDKTTSARPKKWDGTTNSQSVDSSEFGEIQIVQDNNVELRLRVTKGTEAGSGYYYPMLCVSTETSTTFEPYSNICPITGFDECKVYAIGVNHINPNTFTQGIINHDTGELEANSNWITTDYIPISGWVSLSGYKDGSEGNLCVRFAEYNKAKEFIKDTRDINTNASGNWFSFQSLSMNTAYVRITFGFDNTTTTPEAFLATNRVQLNLGSSPKAYTPYNGYEVVVDLDGKRYYGELDLTSGVMTLTRKCVLLLSLQWTYQSDNQRFVSATVNDKKSASVRRGYVLTEKYQTIDDGRPYSEVPDCSIYDGGTNIDIHDSRFTNVTDFANDNANSVVVYELAEPFTVQLIPTQVKLIHGYNYIVGSTGDISLLTANIDNTVEQLEATVESQSATIATQGETIASQGETIAGHTETIATQGSTITSQGQTIASQGATITSQGQAINGLTNKLTANSNIYTATFQNNQYGFMIGGTFYPFNRGAKLVGTYINPATIDVSAYAPTSASQFILAPITNEIYIDEETIRLVNFDLTPWKQVYQPASIALSGNTLSIVPPYWDMYNVDAGIFLSNNLLASYFNVPFYMKCNLYFVGTIS